MTAIDTSAFNLSPGDRIKRTELHQRFGGRRQGGISPSTKTPNVFIFTDPKTGRQHGYVDGWQGGGEFHYTGEGQTGKQELKSGNLAILEHRRQGRALRLFRGSGGTVTYEGEFEVDQEAPYYRSEAPSTGGGQTRSVIVFRLRPLDAGAPQVLVCPAAGALPRKHLQETVVTAIQLSDIQDFVSAADRNYLGNIYPEGFLWAWGLRPGKENDANWARLKAGDTTVFFTERALRYASRVRHKLDSEILSDKLWGRDPENRAFSHIFFIDQPAEVEVSLEEWDRLLGYRLDRSPQGTYFLDLDRTLRLESYLRLPERNQSRPSVDQDRGGVEKPREKPYIVGQHVTPSTRSEKELDREAWRQAQDRRKRAHADLLDAIARAARRAHFEPLQNQYIDLIVDRHYIIEAKSIAGDAISQARAALSQLYHYKFIHRDIYPQARLVVVFSEKVPAELMQFLESCDIAVSWREGGGFGCYGHAGSEVPWLCSATSSDEESAAKRSLLQSG